MDRDSGTIVEHALLGWRDVDVRGALGTRTGLAVHVDGHARVLVNGERLFGRARGSLSVLHLFVGNVVDAAFATHDEVHRGPPFPQAGRSPICRCRAARSGATAAGPVALQAELSERTLCRRAREAGVITTADPMHAVGAAADGDPVAVRLLLERARTVGRAARLLLDVLNPDNGRRRGGRDRASGGLPRGAARGGGCGPGGFRPADQFPGIRARRGGWIGGHSSTWCTWIR